jgi:Na+/H+ antiporter NhaC
MPEFNNESDVMSTPKPTATLQFYGGMTGLFIPFIVMFVGILWLGVLGDSLPEAFWPVVLVSLFVGLLLARDKNRYVDALIEGIASPMMAIMLLAWMLGGIFGALLSTSGVIEGLIWLAAQTSFSPAWYPLITFFVAALLSLCTGSSIGTLLAITPVLFPASFSLGADPFLLIGALIGGAYLGDNLAPISDTTIVSAYTQGTSVSKVVRSRLRYALVASSITVTIYVYFALTSDVTSTDTNSLSIEAQPRGLLMLLAPAVLLVLMLKGYHLVSALLYCIFGGSILALVSGLIQPADLLQVNSDQFVVSGVVVDGIKGMLGVGIFAVLLMALVGVLERGGFLEFVMGKAEVIAVNPTRAEVSIVGSTLLVNMLTSAGTPAMIILGPFVRNLGNRFKIAPWRRGNLLDACSTSIIGFLPYSVSLLIPYSLVALLVTESGVSGFTPVALIPFPFYCWALMLVMVFAAFSGWGREFMSEEAYAAEVLELKKTT